MNTSWPSKHPKAVLDFSWPVPVLDGEAIISILETSVVAGTISINSPSVVGNLFTGHISGGEYGENAIIRLGAKGSSGNEYFEDFLLRMEAAPTTPQAPTGIETASDIAADLVELRAARRALAKGERVEEVWRSGRRLTFGKVTLQSVTTLIEQRERDLEAATASEAGKPRRRPITLGWPS